MKHIIQTFCIASLLFLLAGCNTEATRFSNEAFNNTTTITKQYTQQTTPTWDNGHPVNVDGTPIASPVSVSNGVNIYVATPADTSVKSLLLRWAHQDNKTMHWVVTRSYEIGNPEELNREAELTPNLTSEQSFNRLMSYLNTNRLGVRPLLLYCYYRRGPVEFHVSDNLNFACSPND